MAVMRTRALIVFYLIALWGVSSHDGILQHLGKVNSFISESELMCRDVSKDYYEAFPFRLLAGKFKLSKLGFYRSSSAVVRWTRRGQTSLYIPGHNPPTDITIFMDIAKNPGPEFTSNMASVYSSLGLPRKALNVCHYNICSLGNKLDEIKLILNSVSSLTNNKPNLIFGLTETHLDASWSDALLQVNNFTTHRQDRVNRKGGGLLIYVPSHLPVTRRSDLEVEGIECVCLQLHYRNCKPCLFTFVYRPPSSDSSYLDLLDLFLTRIDCTKYQSVILGDFNFNLLDNTAQSKRFTDLFLSFLYDQLIVTATRPISGSLLDHIYSNSSDNILESGTLPLSLSDHLPVYTAWRSRPVISKSSSHDTISFRSSKNLNVENLLSDLDCIPWNTLDMFTDVNEALEHWYCLFNGVLNTHLPIKTRRVKRQFQPEWFSNSISDAIKQRNCLHALAVRHNTDIHWREYRSARNRVVHLIRQSKRDFFQESIKSNLDNPRHLWRIIRNIAPANYSKLPSHLTVNGITYNKSIDIANLFNSHFANIASAVQLHPPDSPPDWNFLHEFILSKLPNNKSFVIPPVTSSFVFDSLSHLSTRKAVGLDGLSGYCLKMSAPSIATSLTAIFNLSISSNTFPDIWKMAKVSPLFKDGSLFDCSNYRPISILPILSKILERHVHTSLYDFLSSHDLLSDSQFGFRKSRSCELALTDLIDRILTNMDNRLLNGLLLVDLKKAFDLVDHSVLLFKLNSYGCSPSSVEWFTSYLSNRSQRTTFKGVLSESCPMSLGVPQGSILGPLFFLLFINDLPLYVSLDVDLTMFADDTSALVTGPSFSCLNNRLISAATQISAWAVFNRMALNFIKTKALLLTTSQKYAHLSEPFFDIVVNGNNIEQVPHAKLLGITIDSFLSWESHINNMCSLIRSRLSLLKRIKPFLTHNCSLKYYNSCIHSSLLYCSTVWGTCSKTLLLRLLRLQKQAARLILGADWHQPSVSLFAELKWLPIFLLVNLRKLVLLFNILNNHEAPTCLKQSFHFLSSRRITGAITRACNLDLQLPFPRSNCGKRTFAFSVASLFNCLDSDLKKLLRSPNPSTSFSTNLSAFKGKVLSLFHTFTSRASHLEDLFCPNCRYKLCCNCIS